MSGCCGDKEEIKSSPGSLCPLFAFVLGAAVSQADAVSWHALDAPRQRASKGFLAGQSRPRHA